MPIATRTFRVFVSSTFEDLKEERDALQRDVFPKLRTLCEQHGARFQAIDLRWGVRDEAALDQQTVEICLREIRRCQATGVRPNFIVLLGNRYGWQPLPARIPSTEFDLIRPHLPAGDARAMAGQWYRLDENAVPPEYCLQPRTGEFVAPAAWNQVEQTLHEALAKAAWAAGLPEADLIKYEASATHQEILAGLGETEADRQHVFGFFRRPSGEADARLEDLKSYLRGRLPGNIAEFDLGETAALCDAVFTHLGRVIEAEMKRFEDRPVLDLEIEAHDRFAEERCRIFTGRRAVLDTIADYIRGPERRPLVLHGESGSGKSAVIAKASEQYKGTGRMIRRFIGASPESASGHTLLTSLCRQLVPGETPVDYAKLEAAFKERLAVAAAERPLAFFIDALDQLAAGDPARDVTWLPPELPPQVKVILSTTDTSERLPDGLQVRLERMPQSEGGQALDEWLREARRSLRPWQREMVLAHFERCGLPLYLKLAAEESRLRKSYTPLEACTLGEGIGGIIDTLFARLASNANHGPVLVERSLGYLAAARYGLTEDEILDVLTEDHAVWNDFDQRKHHEVSERRLPAVVWSRLSLDLEPYLTERAAPGGTVVAFFHRQLGEKAAAGQELRHADLVRYFGAQPAWLDERKRTPNARRAAELLFQQRAAGDWQAAEAMLLDAPFLLSKCAAGLVIDLEADYLPVLEQGPSETLKLIHGALRLSMHVLAEDGRQYAPQIVGRLLGLKNRLGVARFVAEVSAAAPRPWLRPMHLCLEMPGGSLLRTLVGHTRGVNSVAVTPDGKHAVSASNDWTLKVWDLESGRDVRTLACHSGGFVGVALTPDGKRAVSAADWTLKVWDLETGSDVRTLAGHSSYVRGVAMTPDGKHAVSASFDHTLKVWDLKTGSELRTLVGHSGRVNCVTVVPDGKRAVSGSEDKTLKIWNLKTGREIHTLAGHSDSVERVAVTADGKHAVSASFDHTLKVWDLETGSELRTLVGHSGRVNCVTVVPDGKRAVSGSEDKTLKVWDLENGREVSTLEGHTSRVSGVAVTSDGKRAVSASDDGTLKVWDLETGSRLRTAAGHSNTVSGIAATADGRRAVSASHDHTLKVWDVETGFELRTLKGHDSWVIGVAVTPDGTCAISASADGTLKAWDLETESEVRTVGFHWNWVKAVAVTPDGERAVSASGDKTLKVWDLETGSEVRTLAGHWDEVNAVAVTPDGEHAVSASSDTTLIVWDQRTGSEMRTLRGHSNSVHSVAVTPDGKRAVSASADNTIKVWDLETGSEMRTLKGHLKSVNCVAVTPDGRRAVSASADNTIKVWDLTSGAAIAPFQCDASALCCAIAAPRTVVAGDDSGRVYFLALEE